MSNEDLGEYEKYIEALEYSDLPIDLIEAAAGALAFTKSFHQFMHDWRMVKSPEVDTLELEQAFDALVAEYQAACIFLASFKGAEEKLLATHKNLQAQKDVPPLVVNGYKKLAERVERTRASLTSSEG